MTKSSFCFASILILSCVIGCASPKPIKLEAEKGILQDGVVNATARQGFSGDGYATNFDNTRGLLVFEFPAKAGLYDAKINYATGDKKGYELTVNGIGYEGMFKGSNEKFALHDAGLVELNGGQNEITLGRGWAYFDIDYIELTPASKPKPPKKPPIDPVDPNATPATKALMKKLVDAYGSKTFSGTQSTRGSKDVAYIENLTGKTPAIFGGDFMRYSPSRVERGDDSEKEVELLLDVAHKGMIITICWHWNAPTGLIDKVFKTEDGHEDDQSWYKGFQTRATTMDIGKVLADPNGADYQLLIRDIDAIAVQLKRFSDADVPVLWRPLHEAAGTWFWWGSKGPDNYKKLWRLMHDRLTNYHNLHNLIWVDSSDSLDWYPGDDVVDIVGIDRYVKNIHDPLTGDWMAFQAKFNGKKLLALTEFGGVPDVDRMQRLGVWWSYFVAWVGTTKNMNPADAKAFYNSKGLENLK